MEINGYKAFSKEGKNQYGISFPIGKYHCDGPIQFGPNGNGYHFAKRLEDTFRYVDPPRKSGDILIARVIGSGTFSYGEDEYNGYYDLYSVSDLEIVSYLSHSEIIQYARELSNEEQLIRFVSQYVLTEEEMNLFYGKSFLVDLAIDYYQKNQKEAYSEEYIQKKFYKKQNLLKRW